MKIAFVIQDTGKLYGAERVTLQLISWLRNEPELDVVLCLIKETRLGLAHSDIVEMAKVLQIPVSEFEVGHAFSLSLVRRLRAFCKAESIDVFHASGTKAVFHALPAVMGLKTHCVSTVHGWLFRRELKEQLYGVIERFVLRRCSRVIVLSRYYQHLLLEQRILSERLVRIPTGIEMTPAKEKRSSDSLEIKVGFAGRMSEEKQPEIMLELAEKSKTWSLPIKFYLAGDGHLLDALKKDVDRLNLNEVVEFVGYVPSETFLPKLDVLINCSKIENLPYSLLEAMRLGIPVIAFDVGGVEDLVENGETGFLIPAGDVNEMAEKLKTLISDRTLLQKMGVGSRQRIAEKFRPERVVKAHKELYESCLSHPKGGSERKFQKK